MGLRAAQLGLHSINLRADLPQDPCSSALDQKVTFDVWSCEGTAESLTMERLHTGRIDLFTQLPFQFSLKDILQWRLKWGIDKHTSIEAHHTTFYMYQSTHANYIDFEFVPCHNFKFVPFHDFEFHNFEFVPYHN